MIGCLLETNKEQSKDLIENFNGESEYDNFNNKFMHPHKDFNDHTCFLITLCDELISGGDTQYYKQNPGKFIGATPMHVTNCKHGRYQTGPFDAVYHSVSEWNGDRGAISFYLTKQILQHYRDLELSNENDCKNSTKSQLTKSQFDEKIKLFKERFNDRNDFSEKQKLYIQSVFKELIS